MTFDLKRQKFRTSFHSLRTPKSLKLRCRNCNPLHQTDNWYFGIPHSNQLPLTRSVKSRVPETLLVCVNDKPFINI